jgi:hypothetical protein
MLKSFRLIDDAGLDEAITKAIHLKSDEKGFINQSFMEFRNNIYAIVLSYLKDNKIYYDGLNFSRIWKKAVEVASQYFFVIGPESEETDEDRYDYLCLKKLKGEYYDTKEFNRLHEKFYNL